jgi:alpha-tubulin suppressor-like RCC1 family protein
MAATAISAGRSHSCAVLADGCVWCWGAEAAASGAPAEIGELPAVYDVASGADHACATTFDGETWCWGRNAEAQLAHGGVSEASSPGRSLRGAVGGP